MARRFFYVSLGILALAIAYSLGAQRVEAGFANSNIGIRAVGSIGGTGAVAVVMDSGEVLEIDPLSRTIAPVLNANLPVPASEILFFEGHECGCSGDYLDNGHIITTSGIAWVASGGSWSEIGPLPGIGPVPVEGSSFGAIKSVYRK